MLRRCAIVLALLPSFSNAFYLPGAAPKDYADGEKVPVHVNRLNPVMSGVDSRIVSAHCSYVKAPTPPLPPQRSPNVPLMPTLPVRNR